MTQPAPILLFDCQLPQTALAALATPFARGQLAAGPSVQQLECELGKRFPGYEAVAVSDMTNALVMALRLAGVGEGDEVLSLTFNCMSSNTAISMVRARPIWVDVDPVTASFDVDSARQAITPRTKAVVVYHIAGYPADMRRIAALCDAHGLALIEDANNAFGAGMDGQAVGTFGDFAILSMYANRQINGVDGGVVLCRRPDDADRARRLRRFGIDTARFRDDMGEIDPAVDVTEIGLSATLNNVNATLALSSLSDVDDRIARSRGNASMLTCALDGLAAKTGLIPVVPVDGAHPVYWAWLVRTARRDAIMRALRHQGVQCSKLHSPNHRYSGFAVPTAVLPGTDRLEREMLAIPCGWWIDADDVERLAGLIATAARTTVAE